MTWLRCRRATWAAIAVAVTAGGCQAGGTPLAMSQAPPTVQAAFDQEHPAATVRSVTRRADHGQNLYAVEFTAANRGGDHTVVYNGAGDAVDQH